MWSEKQERVQTKEQDRVFQMKHYPGRQMGFLGLLHIFCWACLVLATWDCTVFPLTNVAFAFTLMTSFIVTGLISLASAFLKIFHLVKAALASTAISTIFAGLQVTAVLFTPMKCSQWLECGLAQTFVGLVMLATSTVQLVLLTYICHQETSRPKTVLLLPASTGLRLDDPPAYHEVVGRQVFWIELFQKVPPNVNIMC